MAKIPASKTASPKVTSKIKAVHTKVLKSSRALVLPAEHPVIVCTEHRGVFFGYTSDRSGDEIRLRGARMAIRFGTTRGVMELAETGPTSASKISARADIEVRKITAIFDVTPEAVVKWEIA